MTVRRNFTLKKKAHQQCQSESEIVKSCGRISQSEIKIFVFGTQKMLKLLKQNFERQRSLMSRFYFAQQDTNSTSNKATDNPARKKLSSTTWDQRTNQSPSRDHSRSSVMMVRLTPSHTLLMRTVSNPQPHTFPSKVDFKQTSNLV